MPMQPSTFFIQIHKEEKAKMTQYRALETVFNQMYRCRSPHCSLVLQTEQLEECATNYTRTNDIHVVSTCCFNVFPQSQIEMRLETPVI